MPVLSPAGLDVQERSLTGLEIDVGYQLELIKGCQPVCQPDVVSPLDLGFSQPEGSVPKGSIPMASNTSKLKCPLLQGFL